MKKKKIYYYSLMVQTQTTNQPPSTLILSNPVVIVYSGTLTLQTRETLEYRPETNRTISTIAVLNQIYQLPPIIQLQSI